MGLPPDLTTPRDHRHGSRLGDIIRRLGSSSEGERAAAVCAMLRLLASVGADLHDVANHIEQPSGLTRCKKLSTPVITQALPQVDLLPRRNSAIGCSQRQPRRRAELARDRLRVRCPSRSAA
jgi:hypothetical protein